MPECGRMERSDAELITAVLSGDIASFEPIIRKYQPRVFATARRYARKEDEVEDIVQEVFIKAFQKLPTFQAKAPFEHWLMRLAIRTCYDFLRAHQRNREIAASDMSDQEGDWLERFVHNPAADESAAREAREIINKVMAQLSPSARMVITLLELEDRSVKEISELTGWSVPLVKVRAFRARAEMRKILQRMIRQKCL